MRYTDQQVDFLRKKCPKMSIRKLTGAFNRRFGAEKTYLGIKGALSNRKIKNGRLKGIPEGTYFRYTEAQAEFIRTHYKRMILSELTVAFNRRFSSQKTLIQLRGFTRNHRVRSGRTGRFEPGHGTWNKGTKGMGICKANSGTFKKGNIPGNVKPLGSERIYSRDGYLLVKTAEGNPYTGAATRYRAKHVLLWERKHGKVSPNKVIAYRDGDKDHCTLKNLMLVTRAELLTMNRMRYREMPDELKPSLLNLAKLKLKIGSRVRGRQ